MIAVSTVVMFGLMYINTYTLDHTYISQTRIWMALIMGSAMAAIMMVFMWAMYPNRIVNGGVLLASAAVFAVSVYLVRSQDTVGDQSYMRAMIPHHSIAILTSERAQIRDPRVRALADDIINTQVREIDEMLDLIADLDRNPVPPDAPVLPTVAASP